MEYWSVANTLESVRRRQSDFDIPPVLHYSSTPENLHLGLLKI
jgi:hypothetical protein